jgi:hypothetical protein
VNEREREKREKKKDQQQKNNILISLKGGGRSEKGNICVEACLLCGFFMLLSLAFRSCAHILSLLTIDRHKQSEHERGEDRKLE